MLWWMLSSVDGSSVTGLIKNIYSSNKHAHGNKTSTILWCTPNLVKSNLKFSDLQGGWVAESFGKEYGL